MSTEPSATTTPPVPGAPASRERAWAPDLMMLAVALIWGINIPVMKAAVGVLHPYAFNALRLTLSVVLLGVLSHLERRGRPAAQTAWPRVIVLGLIGSLLYQVLFLTGIARTTAGNTGLIIASTPIWTAVLASVAGIDRLRGLAWVGLGSAFAGVALITIEGGDLDLAVDRLLGNGLVLAAALSWGLFTVLSKPVLATMSPVRLAYLSSLVIIPAHIALGWPHLGPAWSGELGAGIWAAVLFSGLLSTGLAYALSNYAVRRVGPSHTAIYNNLVPVIALAISAIYLGEQVTLGQMTGGAMILAGLVVMRRAR